MNNGFFTHTIFRTRGLDQGDPLSLPIYGLLSEPLAHFIRIHPNIDGYYLQGTGKQATITGYADDNYTIHSKPTSIQFGSRDFFNFCYKNSPLFLPLYATNGEMKKYSPQHFMFRQCTANVKSENERD